jgi:XTP/dITP diphosphohydrolase
MASRFVLLLTSPRVAPGLLTADAWHTLREADRICCADTSTDLVTAVRAAGLTVDLHEGSITELVGRPGLTVWLADPGAEAEVATRPLAAELVRRSEAGAPPVTDSATDSVTGSVTEPAPGVEVLVGSYDLPGARLLDLVDVMDVLRRECPWDREQTHRSLMTYLVEETYETVEAVESGDLTHLREELGDLLLQVLFHARIAEEHADEPFTVDDVAGGIVEKLVRRHPHVFGDARVEGAAEVEHNWETIKAAEKQRASVLEGVPAALPALSLASKTVGRAGRLDDVALVEDSDDLGDRLLALVVECRSAGVDPEQALRDAVRRLAARVRAAEGG